MVGEEGAAMTPAIPKSASRRALLRSLGAALCLALLLAALAAAFLPPQIARYNQRAHRAGFSASWGITFPETCREVFYASDLGFQGDGYRCGVFAVPTPGRLSLHRFPGSIPRDAGCRQLAALPYSAGISPDQPLDQALAGKVEEIYEVMEVPEAYRAVLQGVFRWELLEDGEGSWLLLVNPQQSSWYYLMDLRF